MSEQKLKIASLNLWRYNAWQERLPNIIDLLKKVDADVVLLQEVDLDTTQDTENQAMILNRELGYPHVHFSKSETLTTWKGQLLSTPVEYGLAVISRIPFESERVELTRAPDDKHDRTILISKFMTEQGPVTITNLHFSNKDDWAESHLKETLQIIEDRGIDTVLAGDFNIKGLSKYRDVYDEKYRSSSDEFSYISYPNDGLSYDYILLPKCMKFESFECRDEYVSDHRMIISEITMPNN